MSVKHLLEQATPLPWAEGKPALFPGDVARVVADGSIVVLTKGGRARDTADVALIVHAVNHLPDYEAAVEALSLLLDRLGVWQASWQTSATGWRPVSEAKKEAREALRRLRGE